MTSWFEALGVECESSDMSLSVSLDGGRTVEWSSTNLSGVFANKWQLFNGRTVEWSGTNLSGIFENKGQLFKPGFYSFLMETTALLIPSTNSLINPLS